MELLDDDAQVSFVVCLMLIPRSLFWRCCRGAALKMEMTLACTELGYENAAAGGVVHLGLMMLMR